jgi:predicted nucleic acid-binding protein
LIACFDTSALVPLLVEEVSSARATLMWDEADRTAGVRLLYAEARAALAAAHRSGRLDAPGHRRAVTELGRLYHQIDMVEVSDALVRRAGDLAEEFALRGYDAVHLAGAETIAGEEAVLVAGDGPLCLAAESLGLAVAHI